MSPTAAPTADPTDAPECEEDSDCDANLICAGALCVRNCAVLEIDEFLNDCSAEWDNTTNTLSSMRASIGDNTASINALQSIAGTHSVGFSMVNASATTNALDIASLSTSSGNNAVDIAANTKLITDLSSAMDQIEGNITTMDDEMTTMKESIESIQKVLIQMGATSAHAPMANFDGATANGASSWWGNGVFDYIIMGLVVFNLLLVGLVVAYCYGTRSGHKYQSVMFESEDSDARPIVECKE